MFLALTCQTKPPHPTSDLYIPIRSLDSFLSQYTANQKSMYRLTTSQAGEKESEERRLEGGDLGVDGQENDEDEEHAKATTMMTVGGASASEMGGSRTGDRATTATGGNGGFPGGERPALAAKVASLAGDCTP